MDLEVVWRTVYMMVIGIIVRQGLVAPNVLLNAMRHPVSSLSELHPTGRIDETSLASI